MFNENILMKGIRNVKLLTLLYLLAQGSILTACSTQDRPIDNPTKGQKSIVILYENDVHCAIDGYAKLIGLRDAIVQADTAWVGVVNSGDFLQGGMAGALSEGEYIADIMRSVGYDAITLGNHELDYGGDRMKKLLQHINVPVVCANFFEYGAQESLYPSYTIHEYVNRRIAYVGVLAPETLENEKYSFFDKDGNQLFDLCTDKVCQLVQAAVDEARSKGADYVVLLSHMGEAKPSIGISSHDLIAATRGIDVVLDGHTHSVIEHDEVANLDGKKIPITQTGTQFAYVGKLVITADGQFITKLIATNDITYKDERVSAAVDSVYQDMSHVSMRKIATSNYELTINDTNGNRLIRSGETNLGDMVTDAFRQLMQAEIGLCNGGGIRNSIKADTIVYGQIVDTLPYTNKMAKIEATGAEIIAMLQACTSSLPNEDGQFPQVSGLRYTIHQKSDTVSNVEVLSGENWEPIDNERKYTIALTEYYIGGGFHDKLKDCTVVTISDTTDTESLADYMEKTLGGVIPSEYATPQGRITIVDD